jgi:hypothetical protein
MPADLFSFKATDPIVTKYLNATERAAVALCQTSTEYEFEFHTGHDTGNPIYVRPDGNTDKKNLPKFDTKNKTAASYHARNTTSVSVNTLANGGKLASALGSAAQLEIETLISASWASLALLATRFWTDTLAPAVVVAATDKACKATGCAGRVPITSSKSACDTCFAYQ